MSILTGQRRVPCPPLHIREVEMSNILLQRSILMEGEGEGGYNKDMFAMQSQTRHGWDQIPDLYMG